MPPVTRPMVDPQQQLAWILSAPLTAQFLSAFADNAILFTAIAMVLSQGDTGGWYVPAMQSAFLVAFVLLPIQPESDR